MFKDESLKVDVSPFVNKSVFRARKMKGTFLKEQFQFKQRKTYLTSWLLMENHSGCLSQSTTIQGFQRACNCSSCPSKSQPSCFQPPKETEQL